MAWSHPKLEGQFNYLAWHRDLRNEAYGLNVWELIQGTEVILIKPSMPKPPTLGSSVPGLYGDDNNADILRKRHAWKVAVQAYEIEERIYVRAMDGYDKQRERSAAARTLLFSSISGPTRMLVSDTEGPSDVYDKINSLFKPSEEAVVNKAFAILSTLRVEDCTCPVNFMALLMSAQAEIKKSGHPYSNSAVFNRILECMPKSQSFRLRVWQGVHGKEPSDRDLTALWGIVAHDPSL